MGYLEYVILTLDFLMVAICWLPTIRLDHWIFRIPEYPRLQELAILIFLAVVTSLTLPWSDHVMVAMAMLCLAAMYLLWRIWPFTKLSRVMVADVDPESDHPEDQVSIMVVNVYQHNRKASELLSLVEAESPDLLLVVETDDWWSQSLQGLKSNYEWCIEHPLENTYGMLFFSKLPVSESVIAFRVVDDQPSIEAKVTLPSGRLFEFFGVHPAPPGPQHDTFTTKRDKELLIIAKDVARRQLPIVIAGDLNDVAWSYTTRLMTKIGQLLDLRVGRGMFSTFHAKYPLLRWPLDHVFCSSHFTLVGMKRLRDIGSDHFPLLATLQMEADPEAETATATTSEKLMALEKIRK